MKEKIKTISLIVLVILGIYLTQKIWIEFPDIILNFLEEDEVVDETNLLEGIIVPEKYQLNFGEEDFTLIYDDTDYGLWEEAKESIEYVFSSKDILISQITTEEYFLLKENRFIEFEFTEPINSHLLSSTSDSMDLSDIVEEMEEIHRIYISLDEDEFFIFTRGDNHILIEDKNLNLISLKSQVDNIGSQESYIKYISLESISPDIYIPATMDIDLPVVNVSNSIRTLDEVRRNKLVERFFSKEIDYIREIVESNGSTIYEYDNHVLKLNSNGVLEYFHVLDDNYPESNLYISLSTAMEFLINRVGIENDVFLSKVEEIQSGDSNGYRLYFRYKTNNIPILVDGGFKEYIQVDIFNNQIKSFRQLAHERQIDNSRNDLDGNIISPLKIIDNNLKYFEETTISSIDLSYFDSISIRVGERLKLVWVIETTDFVYAFDAYTGSLLYER